MPVDIRQKLHNAKVIPYRFLRFHPTPALDTIDLPDTMNTNNLHVAIG